MGQSISTAEDSRASTTTTVSHAVFSPSINNHNHNNTMNGSPSSSSANNNRIISKSNLSPVAVLLPYYSKPSNANRVISFRSTHSFRGYLEASRASNTLIVIDFINRWCGRCRYMESTLHEFAAKYTDVEFVKVDVDEFFDLSREYGVQTTPTFMLVKKGKLVDKVDGARKEELQRKIENHSVVY